MKKEENVKNLVKKYNRATTIFGLNYLFHKMSFIAGVGMFLIVYPIQYINYTNFEETTFYQQHVASAQSEAYTKFQNNEITDSQYNKELDYIASGNFTEELMKICPDSSFAKRHKHTKNCMWADLAILGSSIASLVALTIAHNKSNKYERILKVDYDYDVDKELYGEFLDNNEKENSDYKDIYDL